MIHFFFEGAKDFSPLSLDPVLWLSPDGPFYSDAGITDVTGINGASVLQWNDRSGNNNHAVAPSSAARGTLLTEPNRIDLDGTDDEYDLTSVIGVGPTTFAMRYRPSSIAGTDSFCSNGGINDAFKLKIETGEMRGGVDGIANWDFDTSTWNTTDFQTGIIYFTPGANATYRYNGTTGATVSATTPANGINQLFRANSAGSPERASGEIRELLIFDRILTTVELEQLEAYLAR